MCNMTTYTISKSVYNLAQQMHFNSQLTVREASKCITIPIFIGLHTSKAFQKYVKASSIYSEISK